MIRERWIVGLRNKLGSLAMECNSVSAIEDCKLTPKEREFIQSELRKVVKYIDSKLRVS